MLRELVRRLTPGRVPTSPIRQSGAMPYSIVNGRVVFLLVTSRRSGRWIFPKGSVSTGYTAWDSAAKEAVEEAGVIGQIDSSPVGTYQLSEKGMLVDVDLYPLLVEYQREEWQEMHQRLRHWALLTEVRRLVENPAIGRIATKLERQLLARP